jgi:ribosome-associated protein
MRIGHISIPDEELLFSFARSGGPGGQNVNKVSSKAILHWNLFANATVPLEVKLRLRTQHAGRITVEGMLVIQSQRFRDQPRNIEDCRTKLGEMVAAAMHVPKPRKATKPSRGAKERRLSAKKHQSQRKAGRGRPGSEE